jgi:diaminohydroxyphosphoribosylaminopyrimidine deaminase / 5-amino-6-(5-phosphoribosylamino)uracil reductase
MRLTLKLATSLDGKIATASGESRWITGDQAREAVHHLRSRHQAILVGVETVIADDPELTVRLPRYVGPQPARVVLDSRQRIPLDSKLVASAMGDAPTLVLTTRAPDKRLTDAGVTVLQVAEAAGRVAAQAALAALNERGWETAMIEGGGQVAASFLSAGLVDNIEWFRAPIVLGGDGRAAVAAFALETLAAAPRFRRVSAQPVGDDLWERYERI